MRRALKILAGLIVAVIIAIVAVILLVPTEKIAQIAADQVKSATGRELTLAGGVSPSFYPVIGVETGAVALSNADWADAPTMVSAWATPIPSTNPSANTAYRLGKPMPDQRRRTEIPPGDCRPISHPLLRTSLIAARNRAAQGVPRALFGAYVVPALDGGPK